MGLKLPELGIKEGPAPNAQRSKKDYKRVPKKIYMPLLGTGGAYL